MKILKINIKKIIFNPFKITIQLKKNTFLSYREEALIASFGSLGNLLLILFGFGLKILGVEHDLVYFLILCNMTIMVINMLPIGPLDGGRLFSSLLLMRFKFETVDKICEIVSTIFLIPFMLGGIYVLVITKYNLSLILSAIYLIFILYVNNKTSRKSACFII